MLFDDYSRGFPWSARVDCLQGEYSSFILRGVLQNRWHGVDGLLGLWVQHHYRLEGNIFELLSYLLAERTFSNLQLVARTLNFGSRLIPNAQS